MQPMIQLLNTGKTETISMTTTCFLLPYQFVHYKWFQRCSRDVPGASKKFQGRSRGISEVLFEGVPKALQSGSEVIQGFSKGFRCVPRVLQGFKGFSRVFQLLSLSKAFQIVSEGFRGISRGSQGF